MANERITEEFVSDHFKNDVLFTSIKCEEQRSSIKRIQDLLRGESKGKGKGNGCPEFILSFPTNSSYHLWCKDFKGDLEQVFKHGTLSLGFIGLSEAIEVITGTKYYSDMENYIMIFTRILCVTSNI